MLIKFEGKFFFYKVWLDLGNKWVICNEFWLNIMSYIYLFLFIVNYLFIVYIYFVIILSVFFYCSLIIFVLDIF